MKIALVHDFLNQYGGGERVLEELHAMFPQAPVYVSIYIPTALPESFKTWDIRTSWMNRIPGIKRFYKHLWFLYPLVFSFWKLSGYDCVISSSSTFAKGICVARGTQHICYCHTPARFIWRKAEYLREEHVHMWQRLILEILIPFYRFWDLKSNRGVTQFVANSKNVQQRIQSYYGRESRVIHPPVALQFDDARISNHQPGEYFLVLSRLLGYKRIDLAIEACERLKLPLKIIGSGRHMSYLKKLAGDCTQFLGFCNETQIKQYLSGCAALIFPGEEDFGIVPLEAMAAGKPVIAYGAGGVLETVVPNQTGLFFDVQSVEDLVLALHKFETMKFDSKKIVQHAKQFSESYFRKQIMSLLQ